MAVARFAVDRLAVERLAPVRLVVERLATVRLAAVFLAAVFFFAPCLAAARASRAAAFAALAGTSPIPASSGRTIRHRLNRGGDRTLNRAMHTIARHRLIYDPATRSYAERRRAEGKTDLEILRCLKRYITRQLYRQLTQAMTAAT